MKALRKTLAALLVVCMSGGLFAFVPSLFPYAEADGINEYTAFYTSFDMGGVRGENYFGVPMRGYYDESRAVGVYTSTANDWMMSMVESVDANEPNIESRGPDKLTDGNASTSYSTVTEFPVVVTYTMREPAKAVVYSVTSTNNYNMNAPMDWSFEGSADGDEWVTLHSIEGVEFSKRSQTKKYSVENEEYFKYYRMVITKKAGGETSGTV